MTFILASFVHSAILSLSQHLLEKGMIFFSLQKEEDFALENEKELVKAAKNGDSQAFTQLYNHYFPKIYSYLMRRTGHEQTTEDLTSQVFLKAFNKLPKFVITSAPFGAWLFRIAANTLTDYYRKASRNKEFASESLPEKMDESKSALEEVMTKETKEQVLTLVGKLSKKDQQMVELRFLAELGVKEIAAVVELSPNVVSVRIYRAVKKLQKLTETMNQ